MRYAVVLLLLIRVAHAHQSSTKYLDVTPRGDDLELALRFAPGDVTEPMKMRPDAKPAIGDVMTRSSAVAAYVQRWVTGCAPITPGDVRPDSDNLIAVTWRCAKTDPIVLDFTAFFSLDKKMEMFVRVADNDSIRVTSDKPTLTIELDQSSYLAGVTLERCAFVLLIALVTLTSLRALAISLCIYAVAILVGTYLPVAIPAGHILVAGSLVYAGIETMFRPDWRWRIVTFGAFGVIHGIVHRTTLTSNVVAIAVTTALALAVLVPVLRIAVTRFGTRRVTFAIAGAVAVLGVAAYLT